jgi:uncharacterized membrane protein
MVSLYPYKFKFRQLIQATQSEWRSPVVFTAIFFGVVLVLSLHRHFTFYTSYDQGIFTQLFWNNLQSNWFQSSLTSAISVGVVHDGEIPKVTFIHLGHHFVVDFLLWMPLYALFPSPVTLLVLQVGLTAAAGLVLYALARHSLEPKLSRMITGSYFCAIAVIGPTLANFYEHCQMPLFTFGLLLAMEKRRWVWFWVMAALVLGIREEAGFITFGIGLYLLFSRRHPRVGAMLCLISFIYVVVVTAVVIPSFSSDSSRLYLVGRFSKFVPGNSHPSTLQVLWGFITHPIEVLKQVFDPVDQTFIYLFVQALPLAFVPLVARASWLCISIPFLSLAVQAGHAPLNYTIRYALMVVPGLFYGAIVWWSARSRLLTPKFHRIWKGCLVLSVVVAIASNPNQSLSFVIPDSLNPWVYVPMSRQWERAATIQSILPNIPVDASVSATTHLIPHLATRRSLIRLPDIQVRDAQGTVNRVDYLAADLWRLKVYARAFKTERNRLEGVLPLFDRVLADSSYGLVQFQDGVTLMKKGALSDSVALKNWQQWRTELVLGNG